MHSMQIVQGIQPSKINRNCGALNMKTPQVKPEWNTGIYIGNGVVATKTCIDCGESGLVFEGENEYEPDPVTGDPRCFSCNLKANPEEYP